MEYSPAEVALTNGVLNDVLVVHGDTPLRGEVRVKGAKNLVSKAMVAALLGETPSRLYDVPRIRDVEIVRGLLAGEAFQLMMGASPIDFGVFDIYGIIHAGFYITAFSGSWVLR